MLNHEELRQLRLLVDFPREELDIEIKGWLDLSSEQDRANLAKAIIAIANSGGGFILCGFQDEGGSWKPAYPRPGSLDSYSQDNINGIVQRYAEPAFHCSVHHVERSDTKEYFPVIIVPGNHTVPIRAKRDGPDLAHIRQNVYYIRRPGPNSEPPQTAREWDELIGRCIRAAKEELLEDIRQIIYGVSRTASSTTGEDAFDKLRQWEKGCLERWEQLVKERLSEEKPSRYEHGIWTVSYLVEGTFEPPALEEFRDILDRARGHETGWPPWWVPTRKEIAPYPYEGTIECWLGEPGKEAAYSDFWRASPQGLMFLLRGYREDSVKELVPGKAFDLTLPIWRVGEVFLHAQRLSAELAGSPATIYFRFRWQGLSGRELVAWASGRDQRPGQMARQPGVISELSVSAEDISPLLPELVLKLTKPLYEIFDFFSVSLPMVQEELSRMLGKEKR
ncbi:MAG: RNA-binding domain-containing protein [Bacillota bacterium]